MPNNMYEYPPDTDHIAKLDRLLQEALDALEKLAKLGNEPMYGNSVGNRIAQETLHNIISQLENNGPTTEGPTYDSDNE